MEIKEYRKAASLEEGYEILCKSKQNRIIGGCTFLHRTRLSIGTAVDLSGCGLNYIRQTGQEIHIGAYTCLRDIEISALVQKEFGGVFKEVLKHFIGVQLRNQITIGAHVYSRYGFSDIIPVLLSLNAGIRLFHGGVLALRDFMNAPAKAIRRDILVEIILPLERRRVKVQMMRSSYNDYSLFCLAVSRSAGNWIIASSAHPAKGILAEKTMAALKDAEINPSTIPLFAEELTGELQFFSNMRASGEYRKELCAVFLRRALEELHSHED